jgi:hypothetical protein
VVTTVLDDECLDAQEQHFQWQIVVGYHEQSHNELFDFIDVFFQDSDGGEYSSCVVLLKRVHQVVIHKTSEFCVYSKPIDGLHDVLVLVHQSSQYDLDYLEQPCSRVESALHAALTCPAIRCRLAVHEAIDRWLGPPDACFAISE